MSAVTAHSVNTGFNPVMHHPVCTLQNVHASDEGECVLLYIQLVCGGERY